MQAGQAGAVHAGYMNSVTAGLYVCGQCSSSGDVLRPCVCACVRVCVCVSLKFARPGIARVGPMPRSGSKLAAVA